MTPTITKNIADVRRRMAEAARRSGRDPASVRLVAVSKTLPAAMIREAFAAGQRLFGENYAQELRDKAGELSDLDIEWHFIGHLQKNKAKYVAREGMWVESVDSIDLARALDREVAKRAGALRGPLPYLVEVNLAGEASKTGIAPEAVLPLVREMIALEGLRPAGLMIIPPYDDDPEKSRPFFQKLRALLIQINQAIVPLQLTELSMGMSHDFEVAIEEGATIVRVGTAIFGSRPLTIDH